MCVCKHSPDKQQNVSSGAENNSLFRRKLFSAASPGTYRIQELLGTMASSDSESNLSGVDVTAAAVHLSLLGNRLAMSLQDRNFRMTHRKAAIFRHSGPLPLLSPVHPMQKCQTVCRAPPQLPFRIRSRPSRNVPLLLRNRDLGRQARTQSNAHADQDRTQSGSGWSRQQTRSGCRGCRLGLPVTAAAKLGERSLCLLVAACYVLGQE